MKVTTTILFLCLLLPIQTHAAGEGDADAATPSAQKSQSARGGWICAGLAVAVVAVWIAKIAVTDFFDARYYAKWRARGFHNGTYRDPNDADTSTPLVEIEKDLHVDINSVDGIEFGAKAPGVRKILLRPGKHRFGGSVNFSHSWFEFSKNYYWSIELRARDFEAELEQDKKYKLTFRLFTADKEYSPTEVEREVSLLDEVGQPLLDKKSSKLFRASKKNPLKQPVEIRFVMKPIP